MKVIVCTGDSHTCGQGADSIQTKYKPKNKAVYNTAGKGISRGGNCEERACKNFLRALNVESSTTIDRGDHLLYTVFIR